MQYMGMICCSLSMRCRSFSSRAGRTPLQYTDAYTYTYTHTLIWACAQRGGSQLPEDVARPGYYPGAWRQAVLVCMYSVVRTVRVHSCANECVHLCARPVCGVEGGLHRACLLRAHDACLQWGGSSYVWEISGQDHQMTPARCCCSIMLLCTHTHSHTHSSCHTQQLRCPGVSTQAPDTRTLSHLRGVTLSHALSYSSDVSPPPCLQEEPGGAG